MEVALREELLEPEIGTSVESVQKLLSSQSDLFHSQINQLQNIVVTQCKLTGVNPLSQEMAADALSIKIGKRPRDLLNPKAVKYMQSIFSIKDAISKKESREISALFGVTVTQVRDFFAGQRSRVRRIVRLSREKAIKSNACNLLQDGVSTDSDPTIPIEPVPLNSVGPTTVEETPSCSTQDETLQGVDDTDKHFIESIFSLMRKEETFSGQVKLMEWILQIQNPSVLHWFLTKGGVMIIATWLSQAANEEQTSILVVILKVLCHLPLHKALPIHISAILQSVNRLRFYRSSDISNRARILLAKWSKMFARSQALKKPNGTKSLYTEQKEIMLKHSFCEIMGDESWQSNLDISEEILAASYESSENFRNLESPQTLKLLPAPADETNRKLILGASSSQNRERRKVQLVEQPQQKSSGRSPQVTRVSQGRPMSADDIQKAKMRAHFMQSKYGKTGPSSNENQKAKMQNLTKSSTTQPSKGLPVSKVTIQPKIEELVRPKLEPQVEEQVKPRTEEQNKPMITLPSKVPNRMETPPQVEEQVKPRTEEQNKPMITLPSKVPNRMETPPSPKVMVDPYEPLWEKCKRVQITWRTPPEMELQNIWRVGGGESSKEVEVQRNRNRREKETVYHTTLEIPSNPKEPWDVEMDYDDSLTTEIPTEQLPDADVTESQVSPSQTQHAVPEEVPISSAPASMVGNASAPEPDLELLAVLLKNPDLVFALTSGQAGNLSCEDTVKLLDMIKTGGVGLPGTANGFGAKVEEKIEVSLPSPTPSSNPGTSGWKPEVAKNPFSKQAAVPNSTRYDSNPAAYLVQPQVQATNVALQQHPTNVPLLSQQLPAVMPEKQQLPFYSNHQIISANSSFSQTSDRHGNHLSAAAMNSLQHESLNIGRAAPVPITLSQQERSPVSYPVPEYSQTMHPQSRPTHYPDSYMPSYPTRPSVENPGPDSEYWRARQGLAPNPRFQADQNDYNTYIGGHVQVQPPMQPGPSWERNEYAGEEEFESWSPDNSPRRSPEYSLGRNLMEQPRMNHDRNYRPERSRQRNTPGYWGDNNCTHGNRRWRGRERRR